MTTPVTLEEYQRAERAVTQRAAWTGLRIHAVVTALVWAGVILLNVFVAPGFPWSIFVILGTGLGVFFHWYGYRHADDDTRRRQENVVQYARAHSTTNA
jgi:type III secretory pathway component EscV